MLNIRYLPVFTLILFWSVNSHAWWWSSESTYTKTQHPIVLIHGLYGFDDVLGMDYFFKVTEELESGGAEVYVLTVPGVEDTSLRGEELLKKLENLSVIHNIEKFNLIGHSHGGPTARYVASVSPSLVASVTSVGGPNKGTPIADLVAKFPDDSFAQSIVEILGNALGIVINLITGSDYKPDVIAMMKSVTTEGSQRFNELHPQGVPTSSCGEGEYEVNSIRYYSWSGAKPVTNLLDPVEILFLVTRNAFDESSDGLVSACSSHLGKVIRDDYAMNHLDEVNLMLGLHDLWSTDPLTIYRKHANRLKKAGL